ncbi:hypothetical protein GCM10022206_94450 [Streptomyces chiangmaiensis]
MCRTALRDRAVRNTARDDAGRGYASPRILRAAGLGGVFELHPRLPESLTAASAIGFLPTAMG